MTSIALRSHSGRGNIGARCESRLRHEYGNGACHRRDAVQHEATAHELVLRHDDAAQGLQLLKPTVAVLARLALDRLAQRVAGAVAGDMREVGHAARRMVAVEPRPNRG